jgi:hypothetical protein
VAVADVVVTTITVIATAIAMATAIISKAMTVVADIAIEGLKN